MTFLRKLFARRKAARQLSDLARHVAREVQDAVWQRVRHGVFEMSLPESRGYVRVCARPIVRRQLELALTHWSLLDAGLRDRCVAVAADRVAGLIIGEMLAGSPVARRRMAA